ncbi:hypothetical protein, partial [Sphingobacteruim zhuxiongii]|uniref:hypothetical protein n=1 Tax=Sphingobacterium zhuxiongii TaxID=2662364 RepID=UPI001F3324B9
LTAIGLIFIGTKIPFWLNAYWDYEPVTFMAVGDTRCIMNVLFGFNAESIDIEDLNSPID